MGQRENGVGWELHHGLWVEMTTGINMVKMGVSVYVSQTMQLNMNWLNSRNKPI